MGESGEDILRVGFDLASKPGFYGERTRFRTANPWMLGPLYWVTRNTAP